MAQILLKKITEINSALEKEIQINELEMARIGSLQKKATQIATCLANRRPLKKDFKVATAPIQQTQTLPNFTQTSEQPAQTVRRANLIPDLNTLNSSTPPVVIKREFHELKEPKIKEEHNVSNSFCF